MLGSELELIHLEHLLSVEQAEHISLRPHAMHCVPSNVGN